MAYLFDVATLGGGNSGADDSSIAALVADPGSQTAIAIEAAESPSFNWTTVSGTIVLAQGTNSATLAGATTFVVPGINPGRDLAVVVQQNSVGGHAVSWTGVTSWQTGDGTALTTPNAITTFLFVRSAFGILGYKTGAGAAVDQVAPTVGTLSSSAITSTGFTLTVNGASDLVGLHATPYRYSSDNGGSWSFWQEGATFSFSGRTASTSYQARHQVRDAAGNVSDGAAITVTTASASDGVAPTPGTIAGSSITATGFTLTITGASDAVGLHATPYAFSTDSGVTWTAYQSAATLPITGKTASTGYQVKGRVRDAAGNTADTPAVTVTTIAAIIGPGGVITSDAFTGADTASLAGRSTDATLGGSPKAYTVLNGTTLGIVSNTLQPASTVTVHNQDSFPLGAAYQDIEIYWNRTNMPTQVFEIILRVGTVNSVGFRINSGNVQLIKYSTSNGALSLGTQVFNNTNGLERLTLRGLAATLSTNSAGAAVERTGTVDHNAGIDNVFISAGLATGIILDNLVVKVPS